MPSVSKKQHNFMAAVANNPKFAKKAGVPKSVGEDFMEADKGMKFGKSSTRNRADLQSINKPTVHRGKMKLFAEGGEMAESKKMVGKEIAFMKKKGAPKSMIKHEMEEMKSKKKMATGGMSAMPLLSGRPSGGVTNAPTPVKRPGVSGGSMGGGSVGSPIGTGEYTGGFGKPGGFSTGVTNKLPPGSRPGNRPGNLGLGAGGPNKPYGMKGGGLAAGHKQADGIAKKGKTRGMEVKMAAGGLAAGHKQADGIAQRGKTRAMKVAMSKGGKAYGGKC